MLANDTDVDGDALTAILVSGPAHGSLTLNADGSFTYTPAANYNGPDSFTYKANDGQADSNVATVSITVGAVNDAPVADADSIAATEDTPASRQRPGQRHRRRRRRPERGPGQRPGPWQPDAQRRRQLHLHAGANYNGPDSFTYKANDGQADSNVATVSITVGAVNDAPVADADSIAATEDTPAVGNVLANDTDVDGDALSAILVIRPRARQPDAQPRRQLHLHAGANYNGPDSFTYKANDGQADSNVATVTITVGAVNDAPVAQNDTTATTEDTPGRSATCWPTTPTSTATPSLPSWSAVRPTAA